MTKKDEIINLLNKYSDIFLYIGIFLVLLYPFNISFKDYIFSNQISIFIYYIVASFFIFISNYKNILFNLKKYYKSILTVSFLALFVIIFRNGDILHGHFGMPFFTVFLFVVILLLQGHKNWEKITLNVLLVFIIEHVLGTLICYVFRDFYFNNILPLFSDFTNELLYEFEHYQAAGITQHYSTNAAYLLVGIIVQCFTLKFSKKDIKNNIFRYILFLLTIIALLLTGKRAQVLFGLISIIIVVFINNAKKLKNINIKKYLKIIAVAIVCFIITVIFVPSLFNPVNRTLDGIKNGDLFKSREPLYNLAIEKFKESPIIGNGWGSYKYLYNESNVIKERDYMDTHNIYLQMLCEIGIVGLLLFIYVIGSIINKTIISIKKRKNIYLSIFLAYQIYILFEGIVGNAFYDIPVLVPYSVFLAMYVQETILLKEKPYEKRNKKRKSKRKNKRK